jgi:hypothetical protein
VEAIDRVTIIDKEIESIYLEMGRQYCDWLDAVKQDPHYTTKEPARRMDLFRESLHLAQALRKREEIQPQPSASGMEREGR